MNEIFTTTTTTKMSITDNNTRDATPSRKTINEKETKIIISPPRSRPHHDGWSKIYIYINCTTTRKDGQDGDGYG
jgi:hypothetical protein